MNFKILKLFASVIFKLIKSVKRKKKADWYFKNGMGHLAVVLVSLLTETVSVQQRQNCISFPGEWLCLALCDNCSRRAARCNGAFLARWVLGRVALHHWNLQLPHTLTEENINEDQKRLHDRNPSGSYIFTSSIIHCLCLCSGTSTAPYDTFLPCAVFSHS